MARILSFGDSPKLHTGYGIVNKNILWYLSKSHQIFQVAWGKSDPIEQYLNNPNYTLIPPLPNDPLSVNTVLKLIQELKPDYLFTSNDFYVWKNILANLTDIHPKIVSYSIIDGPFASTVYKNIIEAMSIRIVATKYAQEQLRIIGQDSIEIPHGINTEKFKMLDKDACRKKYNLQDNFVYGCVNRNNWRKNYPILLYAFSMVKEVYPKSRLFLVCDVNDTGGVSIAEYCRILGLTVSKDILHSPDVLIHPNYENVITSLTTEELIETYNSFHVFVSASMGEGFGIPHLESLGCGVPTILPNNSCNNQFGSWLYESAKYSNGTPALIHSIYKETSYFLEIPDAFELAQKMIEAQEEPELLKAYSLQARTIAKNYDWKEILPMWNEVFK